MGYGICDSSFYLITRYLIRKKVFGHLEGLIVVSEMEDNLNLGVIYNRIEQNFMLVSSPQVVNILLGKEKMNAKTATTPTPISRIPIVVLLYATLLIGENLSKLSLTASKGPCLAYS